MDQFSRTRTLHALPSATLTTKYEGMKVVYIPDGFSLKYCMSNLIKASQRGASINCTGVATFVEDRLDRTPPFLLMSRIGRRASENQGCRTTRLIPVHCEQLSLGFVVPHSLIPAPVKTSMRRDEVIRLTASWTVLY